MKNYNRSNILTALCLLLALSTPCAADQLVYKPVNPAFGGSPLNSQYLLSTAGEQRGERPIKRQSALDRFSETIQASLLNRISQEIADAILGEEAQNSGQFAIGETQINFVREGQTVIINVNNGEGAVRLEVPVGDFL